jgi:hypothetical protein
MVFVGVALWGLHMGATQGLLATMVVDAAPADLRRTAFGFFNLLSGLMTLIASAHWQGYCGLASDPPLRSTPGPCFAYLPWPEWG